MNEVLNFTRFCEEETRSYSVKPYTTIESLRQRVLGVIFIARFGQKITTFQTNRLFVFEQGLTTSRTNPWIKQIKDAMKPVAEGHGLVLLSDADILLAWHHGIGVEHLIIRKLIVDGEIEGVGEELVGAPLLTQHFVIHAAIAS